MSSVSGSDVTPRKGSLEAVLRAADGSIPNAEERGDEAEEVDVDMAESSRSGVVPLETDLDEVEEVDDDGGCILTRILPSSEAAASNEISRSPRSPRLCRPVSPSRESVPVNSSLLVPEIVLPVWSSISTNELDFEYDQSNSLGIYMVLSKSKVEPAPEEWKVLDTAKPLSTFVAEDGDCIRMDNKEGNAQSRTCLGDKIKV